MPEIMPYVPFLVMLFGEEKGLQYSNYCTVALALLTVLMFAFWLVRRCCPSFEDIEREKQAQMKKDEDDAPYMHTRAHDAKKKLLSTST